MKEKNYSEYGKYLLLADNSSGRLLGTYINYMNFKAVK